MGLNLDDYQNENTWITAVRGIQTSENGAVKTSASGQPARQGLTTPSVADAMSGMLLYKPRGSTYDLFNQRLSQQLAGLRAENNPDYNYSDYEHRALSPYDVYVGPPGDTSFGLTGVGVGAAVDQAGTAAATGSTTGSPGSPATGNDNTKMIYPTDRHDCSRKFFPGHDGWDLQATSGSNIYAPLDGVVTDTNANHNLNPGGYGEFFFYVKHRDDLYTLYGHPKQVFVKPGDEVKQGQVMALSGGDPGDPGKGNARGAHLHFEVHRGPYGSPAVDPASYLD